MIESNPAPRNQAEQFIMVQVRMMMLGLTGVIGLIGVTGVTGCQKIQWFDSPIPVVAIDAPESLPGNLPENLPDKSAEVTTQNLP